MHFNRRCVRVSCFGQMLPKCNRIACFQRGQCGYFVVAFLVWFLIICWLQMWQVVILSCLQVEYNPPSGGGKKIIHAARHLKDNVESM